MRRWDRRGLRAAGENLRSGVCRGPADDYSPAECIGCEKNAVTGNPDPKHISTSFAERQNLTMRMHMRRFTRLTKRVLKKAGEPHPHDCALHVFYNFTKIHKTLRVTPAMQAGLTDHVWSMEESCGYSKNSKRRFQWLRQTETLPEGVFVLEAVVAQVRYLSMPRKSTFDIGSLQSPRYDSLQELMTKRAISLRRFQRTGS